MFKREFYIMFTNLNRIHSDDYTVVKLIHKWYNL